MAATAGSARPRPPPPRQSAEGANTVFSERPIRPLPKRRIKSRLSEELADKITYPPVLPSSSPVFGSPSSQSGSYLDAPYYSNKTLPYHATHNHGRYCECGGEFQPDSEEETEERGILRNGYNWPDKMTRIPRPKPQAPLSATSSADGYESFENTNNKKKRKIPIPGAGSNGLPLDVTSTGIASHPGDLPTPPPDRGPGVGQYYGSGSVVSNGSGIGIAGAGRGRNGRVARRVANERQSLGSTSNALTDSINGLSLEENQGIISAAMASAEINPISIPKGQENVSLLQRKTKSSPEKPRESGWPRAPGNDFTFECKSHSSNKFAMSTKTGQDAASVKKESGPATAPGSKAQSSRRKASDTQAGTDLTSSPAQAQSNTRGESMGSHSSHLPLPAGLTPIEKKARRLRRLDRELDSQARQRRVEQEYKNRHAPPRKEDAWICPYEEYEWLFGEPPKALIRQYELKDRKRRREAEERARLLEKAKAKGRKTKKGAKNNAKNAAADSSAHDHPASDHYDPHNPSAGLDSPEDEYYDDQYPGEEGSVAPPGHAPYGYENGYSPQASAGSVPKSFVANANTPSSATKGS